MEKIKVIALKSFEYDGVVQTPQSPPFYVNKLDLTFFESNKMVKIYIDQDNIHPEKNGNQISNIDENPQQKTKTKKKTKNVDDNT